MLEALAHETREGSHLAVRELDRAVVIARVDGSRPLRVVQRVGDPRPLPCAAIGKVLLAFMPDGDRQALLARLRFTRNTPRTLADRPSLEKNLRQVRANGYATDDEEFALGVRCVAAPVFAPAGRVVAAVGVLGPVVRFTRGQLPEFVERVKDAGRRRSRTLAGGSPSRAGAVSERGRVRPAARRAP